MKNALITGLVFSLIVLALSAVPAVPISSSAITRNGNPIGTKVSCMINVQGPGASEYGSEELYNVKITVREVVRGKEAWARLQAASPSNKPAEDGYEYVLAHILFEFYSKGAPGNKAYTIKQDDFKVYSENNQAYEAPSLRPPKPELIGQVFRSGDSHEGWVPLLVAQKEEKPHMFFFGGVWFELY
jgi:hypothetical protein